MAPVVRSPLGFVVGDPHSAYQIRPKEIPLSYIVDEARDQYGNITRIHIYCV
jgi:hypothetical protein